jgi:hypothetical protein
VGFVQEELNAMLLPSNPGGFDEELPSRPKAPRTKLTVTCAEEVFDDVLKAIETCLEENGLDATIKAK